MRCTNKDNGKVLRQIFDEGLFIFVKGCALMKAAVLKKPGDFELVELPEPECPPGGLIIRMQAAAICSADVKMIYQGHQALSYPRIPGHEIAGTVAYSDVPDFKGSERVQVAPGIVCTQCRYCRRGVENHCKEIQIIGFTMDGGFAEYLAVTPQGVASGIVNQIPGHLSFAEASLAEPLACCINGQKSLGITKGDAVLVIGAGPIGCLHAMLSRLKGAQKILIADRQANRISSAASAGADRLIDLSTESLTRVVAKETASAGVDAIILACTEALEYPLLDLLAPQGKICVFSGLPGQNPRLDLDGNAIHYKETMVVGAYGCTAGQNKQALELMASGRIKVDWLITHHVSPKDIHHGIELVKKRVGLKTIINF